MKTRFFILLFIGACESPVAIAQEVNDAAALKLTILQDWERSERQIRTFRIKFTEERFRSESGAEFANTDNNYSTYTGTPGHYRFEYTRTEPHPVGTLPTEMEMSNPQYVAKIRRRPESDWILISHQKANSEAERQHSGIVLPWTSLPNFQLSDWLRDPLVHFTRIEAVNNSPVLRMHFLLTTQAGKTPIKESFRSGYFDFDSSRSYCLIGYSVQKKTAISESTETCRCQYVEKQDIPTLKHVVIEISNAQSGKLPVFTLRNLRTYEVEYNTELADDEYWLSQYGLPEPVGVVRPRNTRKYIWFLLAAGAFALAGIILRILSRGKARTVGVP